MQGYMMRDSREEGRKEKGWASPPRVSHSAGCLHGSMKKMMAATITVNQGYFRQLIWIKGIHVNSNVCKDLCRRAKHLEFQQSQKYTFNAARISALETLLRDVYAVLRPSSIDFKHRRNLIHEFDMMAKENCGHCGDCPVVEAFGSFVMDMFTEASDLDLSLNFCADETASFDRGKKIFMLKKFAKFLYTQQRKGKVSGVLPILRARVPVLKVVHRGTGIECDISVENKDGISRSLIINLICLVDERFRILSFLMKAWAKAHGINSSKDHTLSSLSIILLVAFHLQTRDPPILPPFSALLRDGPHRTSVEKTVHGFKNFGEANKESVAELFISLLCKLSSVRSLWESGLCTSTYEGSWISKSWKTAKISVEDFLDQSQNCARAVDEVELPKIYSCIDSSICHLMQFMNGQMESSDLNFLLFGPVSLHTRDKVLNGTMIPKKQKKKRKVLSHDSVAAPPLKNVSVADTGDKGALNGTKIPTEQKKEGKVPSHDSVAAPAFTNVSVADTRDKDALNGTKIPKKQKKKRKVSSHDSVTAPPSKNVSVADTGDKDALNGTKIPSEQKKEIKVPSHGSIAAPASKNVSVADTHDKDALNGTKIPTEQKKKRELPSHDSVAAPPSKNVSVAAPFKSKKICYTGRSGHLHSQIQSATTLYPKHFVPSYHQPIPSQRSFEVQAHLKPPPDFSLPCNRQWPLFLSPPTSAAYGSHLQGAPSNVYQVGHYSHNLPQFVAPNLAYGPGRHPAYPFIPLPSSNGHQVHPPLVSRASHYRPSHDTQHHLSQFYGSPLIHPMPFGDGSRINPGYHSQNPGQPVRPFYPGRLT